MSSSSYPRYDWQPDQAVNAAVTGRLRYSCLRVAFLVRVFCSSTSLSADYARETCSIT